MPRKCALLLICVPTNECTKVNLSTQKWRCQVCSWLLDCPTATPGPVVTVNHPVKCALSSPSAPAATNQRALPADSIAAARRAIMHSTRLANRGGAR